MPLYEYSCRSCDHRFEVLQRLGDGASGIACPACGEAQVEKQFSTFASSSSGSDGAAAALGAGGCGGGSGFS